MKFFLFLVLSVGVFLGGFATETNAQSGNIVEVAIAVNGPGSPYEGQFDTLIAAVLAADPVVVETLTGKGQFTVFAPTDDAFAALGLDASNVASLGEEALTQILLYHVVRGRRDAGDVTTSDRIRSLQVAQRIPDRRDRLEIGIEAPADLAQHAGHGFAAGALRIGSMRAVEDRVDPAAHLGELAGHLVVDGVERSHIEQAAPDPRLIGCNGHPIATLIEQGDRLEAARNGAPFIRRLDETVAIEIDDAVAVEYYELHAESREMFATRFKSVFNWSSSAKRFVRTASSGTTTRTSLKNRST